MHDDQSSVTGRGRSGNDYLQRTGGGYESWGAEGPSGAHAEGGVGHVLNPEAGREWGGGVAGGYGRSGDYGHAGGSGRWGGADAGAPASPDAEGGESLVARHWLRDEGSSRGARLPGLLVGVGIGAALMYFLDGDRGASRRQLVAERARSALRSGQQLLTRRSADADGVRGSAGARNELELGS